jgi:DNA adenine methylase
MIFRYPGSKAKFIGELVPFLDRLLHGRRSFHDVYTGGGSVALFVARRHPQLELHLNDLDSDLSAFWRVVSGDGEHVAALCGLLDIKPTVDLFYELRSQPPKTTVERAFRAVFFNRCCFSGLLHGNPLGGGRQLSPNKVFARFNGKRLVKEIKATHRLLAGRTCVTRMDGADYVRRHLGAAMYLDPPYVKKGDALYRERMTLAAHLRLADALRDAADWVLSYDRSPVIEELYSWAEHHSIRPRYSVQGKKKEWASSEEFVLLPAKRVHAGRRDSATRARRNALAA